MLVVHTKIVDGHYVWMIHACDGLGFVLEAAPGDFAHLIAIQGFESILSLHDYVAHAIDIAHATGAYPAQNLIRVSDYFSRCKLAAGSSIVRGYLRPFLSAIVWRIVGTTIV